MLLAFLLYTRSSLAATVAVLDFASWGASEADTEAATEGVRGALLTAGQLESLQGSDIAAGVSAPADLQLRAAREHAAEARRLLLSGDAPGAISAATEAVSEHAEALSQVGRRVEVADAWYTLGVACAKTGLESNAADAFQHVAALYPRYLEERATAVPASARALLAAAEADAGRTKLSPAEVAAARSALHVDWVVTGALDADGDVELELWGADGDDVRVVASLRGYHAELPLPSGGEPWPAIAADLVARTRAVADADEPEEDGAGDGADRPEGHADRQDAITHRWWFWTGAAAAIGGGVLIGYAVWEPSPIQEPGPDTWSVRVTSP